MAEQWFYSKGAQRLGPISGDELRAMAADGRLQADDLIWKDGMAEWSPARNARGLFPAQVEPPPIVVQSSPPPIPAPTTAPQHEDEDFEEPERVGFGPRFGAVLIDGIATVVAAAVLGGIVGGFLASGARSAAEAELVAMVGGMIGGGLAGILYGLWEGITGAAAGKLAMGLVIAGEDGTPASIGVLMKRYWFKSGIASVFPVIAGVTNNESMSVIGGLWALVILVGCFVALGEKRQALHDMIAHTAVYRKADVAEVGPSSPAPGRDRAPARRRRARGHRGR